VQPVLDCQADRLLSSGWPGLLAIDMGERRGGRLSEWAERKD
jgi:hypothetical protein